MPINHKDGTVSHNGQVVAKSSRLVRIMSDVWATQFNCVVFEPGDNKFKSIALGDDEFGCGHATVDAPEAIQLAYDRLVEASRLKKEQEEQEERSRNAAINYLNCLRAGREVVVVSGRKVRVGTKGLLLTTRDGNYGQSALIEDANGNQRWLPSKNLRRSHELLTDSTNQSPIDGHTWQSVFQVVMAEDNAAYENAPKVGHKVLVRADNTTGVVFWKSDNRLGIKATPQSEPRWMDAHRVCVVHEYAVVGDMQVFSNARRVLYLVPDDQALVMGDGDVVLGRIPTTVLGQLAIRRVLELRVHEV